MTDQAPAPAPAAPVQHPGFLDRVGAALHHAEADAQHAAQVIGDDAAKAKALYLEHAAQVHEMTALALRALQAADPAEAATLEQIVARVLPVAETAARITGAVLAAL